MTQFSATIKGEMGGILRLLWTPFAILLSLGFILGFFQNCTPAVPFGNTDYYSALVNSQTFPYDVGFDQVAYLSCNEQQDIFNDGTFFTFRVGAYDSMGLRVNQEFRDSIRNVGDENVVQAMEESQSSAGTRIQLAIRTMDNLQLMYADQDNGDGLEGSDYSYFFPTMGDPGLSSLLWYMEPGDYVRYWAGAQFISEYRFEGELQFMKSQVMENDLRSFLSNRGIIALTFASAGEITPIGPGSLTDLANASDPILGGATGGGVGSSGSSGNNTKLQKTSLDIREDVFGMAVQPRFKQPLTPFGGNPGSDMPPRILSSINEVQIDGRSSGSLPRPWTCPENMNFMIVLPEHANGQRQQVVNGVPQVDGSGNPVMEDFIRCATEPDPINPTPEFQRLRQSFFAEDWYIDLSRKCIVPKPDHVEVGSCYGVDSNTSLTHVINYDTFDVDGCGFGNAQGLCPHYASVCYRQ